MNIKNHKNWIIERYEVGPLMVNCYIVRYRTSNHGFIVDPGDEGEIIIDRIRELDLQVSAIINTHGHGDHIGANNELMDATNAPLLIGREDAPMLSDSLKNLSEPIGMPVTSRPADRLLAEGDTVRAGEGLLRVIDTPGHSRGSVSLVAEDFVIVGDVLFAGSIGRTDFPGGSINMLLKMIREKLIPLGDDIIIYPGHGPESTIGIEKRSNPFLQSNVDLSFYI